MGVERNSRWREREVKGYEKFQLKINVKENTASLFLDFHPFFLGPFSFSNVLVVRFRIGEK